jgi:serine O-acetyltransferase
MFDNLRADFEAAMGHRKLERGLLRVLMRIETPAIICYRYSHWASKVRIPVVRQLLIIPALIWQRLNQMFLGIFISPDAEIGPGLIIHTPYGVFIPPVKIGSNCTFSTGALIGSGCRSVGDNVYFGAGCKIVGDAKIGNNVVIVANSVVITDVPDNTTIMGVPARIKLPGGRPKKFAWRAGEPGQNGGKPTNGAQANDTSANGQGSNHNGSGNASKMPAAEQQAPAPKAHA